MKIIVHNFKKALYLRNFFWSILTLVALMPYLAFAQIKNPLKAGTILELLEGIIEILVRIGVPVAAVFIMYAGFLFVSARGSEEQITKAKGTIKWTLVGSAILLGAWVIITFISSTIDTLGP